MKKGVVGTADFVDCGQLFVFRVEEISHMKFGKAVYFSQTEREADRR